VDDDLRLEQLRNSLSGARHRAGGTNLLWL